MAKQKQSSAVLLTAILAVVAGLLGVGYLLMQLYQPLPERVKITKTNPEAIPASTPEKSQSTEPEYSLKEEEREYLWSLEHHGNLLNTFGFKEEIKAWQQNDRNALLAFFSDEFKGKLIREAEQQSSLAIKTQLLDVSRTDKATVALDVSNREAFVDWLLRYRSQFADEPLPKGRFDVKTLFPPQSESSDIWTATCVHRMWGMSKDGGPLDITLTMTVDTHDLTEERLAQPGWFQKCDVEQILSAHTKKPMFAEVNLGINTLDFHDNWSESQKMINTGGVYACDFNQDGYSDLFLTDIKAGNKLYLGGSNGSFQDVTRDVGLSQAEGLIAAFADLDNDGWEDLILPGTGKVYRNIEGVKFQDVSRQSNLKKLMMHLPGEFLSGLVMADYDRDGMIDLYVPRSVPPIGSWLESRQPDIVANQLLRNVGGWKFEDTTAQTKTGGGGRSCFASVWADVNDDRWPDLYVINEFGDGALYINQEGKTFEERSIVDSPQDFGSMGLTSGDINNDGDPDFYVSNMYSKAGSRIMGNMKAEDYPESVKQQLRNMVAGGELYQGDKDSDFKAVGKDFQVHAVGWSWGSALADFDNDGWLDLHVAAGFMSRDRSKPDG